MNTAEGDVPSAVFCYVTILMYFKFGFVGVFVAPPAKELEGLGQPPSLIQQQPYQGRGERNFGV